LSSTSRPTSRRLAPPLWRRAKRARQAAEQLTREGTRVRYVRSMLIAEDETCFHLFEGRTAEAVGQASPARGARLRAHSRGARVRFAVDGSTHTESEDSPLVSGSS
jgi:hypothetical protein